MIICVDPIDLRRHGPLGNAFAALAELESIRSGVSNVFDDPESAELIRGAVGDFTRWVYDHCDHEAVYRRGIAYLLSLDDEVLVTTTARFHMYLPPVAGVRRRFLRMLWDATFASPEIYLLEHEEFEFLYDD